MTIYNIDSINGNDSFTGVGKSEAWKTLGKVKDFPFQKADEIRLSGPFREELELNNLYGTADQPVIVSSYEDDEKAKILGSYYLGDESQWTDIDSNLWKASFMFPHDVRMIWANTNPKPNIVYGIETGFIMPMNPNRVTKVDQESELNENFEFFYKDGEILLYCDLGNPALQVDGIEATYNQGNDRVVLLYNCHHVIVENLDVRYSNGRGMLATEPSDNCTFRKCDLYQIYHKGVHFYFSPWGLAEDIFIHRSGIGAKLALVEGEPIFIRDSDHTIIRNCEVSIPHLVAIDFVRSKNCLAEMNKVYDMEPFRSGEGGHPGVYFDGCQDCVAQYNYVENCLEGYEDGAEIENAPAKNNLFYRNIACDNYTNFSIISKLSPVINSQFHENLSIRQNQLSPYSRDFAVINIESGVLKENIIWGPRGNYNSLYIENSPNVVFDNNYWQSLGGWDNFVKEYFAK